MDLTPAARAARRVVPLLPLLALLAVPGLPGCSSSEAPFELSEDAIELPATMLEAYRLANRLALDESDRAYVTKMGSGFTLMNHLGQARNHSFVFHAREGIGVSRRWIIHLIGGVPWIQTSTVNGPDPPFGSAGQVAFEDIADSDMAIAAALNVAAQANQVQHDSIPLPEDAFDDDAFVYAVKILSTAQWPEPNDQSGEPGHVAWRVDFLGSGVVGGGGVPVPLSLARFYLDPATLELITPPIVSAPGGELYPWP